METKIEKTIAFLLLLILILQSIPLMTIGAAVKGTKPDFEDVIQVIAAIDTKMNLIHPLLY